MANYNGGDFKRKYADSGSALDTRLKRQHLMDTGTYYGAPSNSNLPHTIPYAYDNRPPSLPVVRVRGLPFDCIEQDVLSFFHGLHILDILFIHKNGRFSGEAYCVLAYPLEVDFAVQKNMHNMGRRYIEVFKSNRREYYTAIAHEAPRGRGSVSLSRRAPREKSNDERKDLAEHTGILRMRGLPYSATKKDIMEFFEGYQLSENNVHIVFNRGGRPSGDAYVEFANADDSKSAMKKDKGILGSRYIELFPSNVEEMRDETSRS